MTAINPAQELFGIFFAIYFTLIVDRAYYEYRSFDTYNAWQGNRQALRRLLTGWLFIMFLPLIQFAATMTVLGGVNINFDWTGKDIVVLVILGILSFFDLGYYRMYEALLHLHPTLFYSPEERSAYIKEEREEFRSHFMRACSMWRSRPSCCRSLSCLSCCEAGRRTRVRGRWIPRTSMMRPEKSTSSVSRVPIISFLMSRWTGPSTRRHSRTHK